LTEARNPGAGWTEVVVSAPSASFTAVHAARTVLSAIVITEDEAGNLSDFASAPRVRAATYPLGDVGELDDTGNWVANFDGTVDAKADVPVFSKAYATGDGGAGYLPVCDIGPTSNGTTNGVPLTDNLVDFEDLVVFSQSFGASTLSKSGASVLALGAASEGPLRVVLGQARFSEGDGSSMGSKTLQVPIDLRGNPGIVRALHAELGFDASALTFVGFEPGPVLQRESDQVLHFVRNASDGRLTLDLAALGQRAYFDGDGTVGYLHFEMSGGTESFLNWNSLDLRGVDGAELDFDSSSLVETPVVPLPNQVRLLPAAPNPFNPSTTIRFELPSSGEIRLNVYSISGRLVRNLASGTWPAGYHRVTWKGQDERGHRVSSGVYLYELVYEGHRDVRKMLLVK
jgi:hypothetical protein